MTKTIVEKLNLTKYKQIAVLHQPKGTNYFSELSGYDTDIKQSAYDLIFAFVVNIDELKQLVHKVIEKNYLNQKGYLFIAYPKKGNTVYPSYIHRDEIMPSIGVDEEGYVGTSNIKFSRMVGLDETFTVVGLKEDANNKQKAANKVSQRVDDYINLIPKIEKDLQDTPELLVFYQALTPGYRKDWARFVYSAKQETTREKRREEMKVILRAGYKSRDLYRRNI
ncbi:YdeI/OmpD-associated family protein [Pseudogracilibacillus sp. SE30717A]|uniref:YdeI/OmpD-associated family protein n=1 Tax=Pseudogracilibacillus sp. SE30717A TaxID=3098293 RepID=UPI00300E6817